MRVRNLFLEIDPGILHKIQPKNRVQNCTRLRVKKSKNAKLTPEKMTLVGSKKQGSKRGIYIPLFDHP